MGINFEWKCWLGTVLISNFFGHWAETSRPDSNMFLPRNWKIHTIDAEVHFMGTHFQKKVLSTFFRSLRKKLSNARRIFSGRIVKTAFYDSRGGMWVYAFSEKKISSLFFRVLSDKLCNFTKQFSIGLWKLHFFVFRGTFSMRKVFL